MSSYFGFRSLGVCLLRSPCTNKVAVTPKSASNFCNSLCQVWLVPGPILYTCYMDICNWTGNLLSIACWNTSLSYSLHRFSFLLDYLADPQWTSRFRPMWEILVAACTTNWIILVSPNPLPGGDHLGDCRFSGTLRRRNDVSTATENGMHILLFANQSVTCFTSGLLQSLQDKINQLHEGKSFLRS